MRLYLELRLVRFHKGQKWHVVDGWTDRHGVVSSHGKEHSARSVCGRVGWGDANPSHTMEYREFNLTPAPIRTDYLVLDLDAGVPDKDICTKCLRSFITKDN